MAGRVSATQVGEALALWEDRRTLGKIVLRLAETQDGTEAR